MDASFWDSRYSAAGYIYGTAPNAFVAAHAALIPPGPVLCLAEGEGRNAVFFAVRGHPVTAMDQSAIGLAKAAQLAANNNVPLTTQVADLAHFPIEPNAWSAIVATFVHLPPPLRRLVHARVAVGLRPGGVFLFEAYAPDQVHYRSGGPVEQPELLVPLADLRQEFPGLELLIARELIRDLHEEPGHRGLGAVVQLAARKPVSE
jgi:Tellurite resistance protein TehB.